MRDITLGITFYHQFTTRAFASGIPTQLAGSPVISALEENNATPITAGVSVSVDRATVTGLNEVTVVATGGNGFEAGKSYSLFISTGTVGGVSVVGEVVGQFTIAQSAAAVDAANGTDGFGALKTLIDAIPTTAMRGTDSAALAATALTDAVWTNAKAAFIDAAISSRGTADPGDAMTLSDGSIKAASYDEVTAWPIIASDAGVTQIARVGADGDTLETISDEIATRAPSGEYNTQLDANMSTRSSHTAANVWAVGARTLTSFGSLIADIWAYATRTLTAVPSDGATETKQDLIQAEVNGLDGDAMRGTDGANTTVPDAAGTGAALAALIAALQTDLDTLTDARGEPGQGALPVSASTNLKVDYLYKILRNLKKTTATLIQIYNNAGDTVDHKMTIADDGTTYTENEIGSGP